MKNCVRTSFFLVMFMVVSAAVSAKENSGNCQGDEITLKENLALYDEIIIDRTVKEVWAELLDFPIWFFSGKGIKRIKGEPGEIGDILVGHGTYTQIIGVRPLRSIVWKTSPAINGKKASGDKDYVFFDLRLEDVDGKTRFSKSYYSQGFWPEDMMQGFIKAQSEGKTSEFMRHISLAFKAYLETGIEHDDYRKNLLKEKK